MERFTHRVGQFITEWCDKDHCHYCDKEGRCRAFEPIGSYMITPKGNQLKRVCMDAFLERLAELEDKLESGKLIELPCLRKTTLKWKDKEIIQYQLVYLNQYGDVCTTIYGEDELKEAKQKLKDLKGEQ